ncbi:MAG: sulfotransferase [Alphaproteobacteria bacterium]|nr:sulfotransferase [Alphaproteobacteria bacterium]
MLGSALGSASHALVTNESQFKTKLFNLLRLEGERERVRQVFQRVFRDLRFKALWEFDPAYRFDDPGALPDRPAQAAALLTLDVVDQYAAGVGREGWEVWVDHSPDNLRHINSLIAMFPNARFVHLLRDGRGVAASVLPLDWGPNMIVDAAEWWLHDVAIGLAAERRFPDRVLLVRYEELTRNPAAVLHRICEFTGLTFCAEMLFADALKKPAYLGKQHQQVGKQILAAQSEQWRQSLSPREIELFEHAAGDFLSLVGYERIARSDAPVAGKFEMLSLRVAALIRKSLNKRRQLIRQREAIARLPARDGSALSLF